MFKHLPVKGYVSVWTYWGLFIFLLGLVAIGSMAADQEYCSAAARDAVKDGPALNCFEFWLNRYQTLIGGFFALIAAAIGFQAVRSQIDAQTNTEERRIEREQNANRAILAISLSAIIGYCETCAEIVREPSRGRYDGIRMPDLPNELISSLSDAIRWASPDESYKLRKLMSTIQIFSARYGSGANMGADQCEFDICRLQVETERLFGYARTTDMEIDITRTELAHAMRTLKIEMKDSSALQIYMASRPEDEISVYDDFVIDQTECGT